VRQVVLEYQVQQVIGMQDCAFWFLLKRHPEIALAVKDDSELADSIWNVVEEFSHRGTDFLLVRSAKERKEYFDHRFGGMCIKCIHYF